MEIRHICCSHALIVQNNEERALQLWKSTMQRAVLAFVECRAEDAKNYFNAALEIAFIRIAPKAQNNSFCAQQLIQPIEFLVEILFCEDNIEHVEVLLDEVNSILKQNALNLDFKQRSSLQQIKQRVLEVKSADEIRHSMEERSGPSLVSVIH